VKDELLSKAKRKILERYLRGELEKTAAGRPTITPLPAGEVAPVSFPQLQVWLHGQMALDIPFYNETMTVYRQGPLNPAVLSRCLLEIVRRHEIWRTTFEPRDSEPVQIVHRIPSTFPLPVKDLRKLTKPERESEAKRLATEDARRPFDLRKGPLLRALLVRMGDEEYRLYMTFHQIVFDAVTAYRLFLPELSILYEAFSAGKASPLPELAIQYGDFAYWQRKRLSQDGWSEHMAYWRKQLSGELPVLHWPIGRPRPAVESHRGAIQRFALPESLIRPLRMLSRQEATSLYMTLLAAFVALLHRYTGQEDIVVGGFTAGRKHPETEPLLGYFVNPLALRINLSGDPSFREVLSRVRGVVLDALAHEDVPFARVVEEVQRKPDPSRNPIFQIAFSQQPPLPKIAVGWDLVSEEVSNGASKLDLTIVVDDRGDGIFGPITYNPDLFEPSTISQMVADWQTLLAAIPSDPGKRITELTVLTEKRNQISVEADNAWADYPKDARVRDLIEVQVERMPNLPAAIRPPLAPDDKLDRLAVPVLDFTESRAEQFERPHDEIERLLAEIWADVLEVERVSVYDNFFDLGGHSLSAVQVVARLQKRLGLRIKPSELAFQTLRQFAAACKERLCGQ
jgi:acyl carrier protein